MAFPYRAFVCGSARDKVLDPVHGPQTWAEAVARQLMAYRVPPERVGWRDRDGDPMPARLGTIHAHSFPDDESGEGRDAWRGKLSEARTLVIVCTADSVGGWINEAIAEFQRRGDGSEYVVVPLGTAPTMDHPPQSWVVRVRAPRLDKEDLEQLVIAVLAVPWLPLPKGHYRSRPEAVSAPPPAAGSDSLAAAPGDRVTFTAFTPSRLAPAASFLFDLWAHTDGQAAAVAQQAARVGGDRAAGLKAGVSVARSTVLGVVLEIPSLRVADATESLLWDGEPVNAAFVVDVPADAAGRTHAGRALISAAGVPITKLSFVLAVDAAPGAADPARTPLALQTTRPRTAFASYSSRDRAEVLARVQGMKKIQPELDVFVDVLTLRAGQRWDAELRAQIPARDTFFLFWSEHAARSREVEKEWRLALEMRGPDFVDPVPLVDPREVPPPAELKHLHFNDFYLAHIRASQPPKKKAAAWWKYW